jgi:hypothetical protein
MSGAKISPNARKYPIAIRSTAFSTAAVFGLLIGARSTARTIPPAHRVRVRAIA